MTVKEIAEQANVPRQKVYYILRKLGRVPTVDEVINYLDHRGRPIKYQLKECENETQRVGKV